jgi:integrase
MSISLAAKTSAYCAGPISSSQLRTCWPPCRAPCRGQAFASGVRRSELVALDVADLEWRRDGVVLWIRRSKTDQEGKGQAVGVVYGRRERTCPVRALKAWLQAAAITDGPIFRPVRGTKVLPRRLTDEVVYTPVKRAGSAAGLDAKRLGAHSLRRRTVPSAAAACG